MFEQNFRIPSQVVSEKSLTEKSAHTHKHTEKAKTIYPLYTSHTGGGGTCITNIVISSEKLSILKSVEVATYYIHGRDNVMHAQADAPHKWTHDDPHT